MSNVALSTVHAHFFMSLLSYCACSTFLAGNFALHKLRLRIRRRESSEQEMTSEKAVKSSTFHQVVSLLPERSPFAIVGSSGEVFQKAMLSLSSDVAKECRGKQKRKERLPKPKSTGQKVRSLLLLVVCNCYFMVWLLVTKTL